MELCQKEGNKIMKISLVNVSKKYSSNKMVVEGLNLTIENNEFIVIIGPSGCGKTTILKMIAGLEEVTEGAIYFNDTNICKILPKDRNIAMVFQNYALYPNMTVYENMEFCLKNMNVMHISNPGTLVPLCYTKRSFC